MLFLCHCQNIGHVVKIVDNTLDWMYEGPGAERIQDIEKSKMTEEYLLGKTYQAKEEKSNDIQKVGEYFYFFLHLNIVLFVFYLILLH